jgi:hypothetical protein
VEYTERSIFELGINDLSNYTFYLRGSEMVLAYSPIKIARSEGGISVGSTERAAFLLES